MLVVDSQVHIWKNIMLPPIHRQVETYSKDDLLEEMETAGVDAVLLHPPGAVAGGSGGSGIVVIRYKYQN